MNRYLRMCMDWRVIASLAAAGLAVWLFAPDLLSRVIPLLVVAICPLSMVLMMAAMHGARGTPPQAGGGGSEGLGPEERLLELKTKLASVDAERAAIDREMAELGSGPRTAEARTTLSGNPSPHPGS